MLYFGNPIETLRIDFRFCDYDIENNIHENNNKINNIKLELNKEIDTHQLQEIKIIK